MEILGLLPREAGPKPMVFSKETGVSTQRKLKVQGGVYPWRQRSQTISMMRMCIDVTTQLVNRVGCVLGFWTKSSWTSQLCSWAAGTYCGRPGWPPNRCVKWSEMRIKPPFPPYPETSCEVYSLREESTGAVVPIKSCYDPGRNNSSTEVNSDLVRCLSEGFHLFKPNHKIWSCENTCSFTICCILLPLFISDTFFPRATEVTLLWHSGLCLQEWSKDEWNLGECHEGSKGQGHGYIIFLNPIRGQLDYLWLNNSDLWWYILLVYSALYYRSDIHVISCDVFFVFCCILGFLLYRTPTHRTPLPAHRTTLHRQERTSGGRCYLVRHFFD